MKLRKLTTHGTAIYQQWLQNREPGKMPPECLLMGVEETEELLKSVEIDPDKIFSTRYEFGKYIAEILDSFNASVLLSERNDGLWNWLTVVYFAQFGKKGSKYWHYAVTRRAHAGSLAYRHLARTSFEMYWRHGERAGPFRSTAVAPQAHHAGAGQGVAECKTDEHALATSRRPGPIRR